MGPPGHASHDPNNELLPQIARQYVSEYDYDQKAIQLVIARPFLLGQPFYKLFTTAWISLYRYSGGSFK